MRLTLASLERLLPAGLKVQSRDRLLFQRLFWGALAGCLATLLLAESPILESMEMSMLEWHYRISNKISSAWHHPLESKDISILTFDDDTQFDWGTLNEQHCQEELASTLEQVESANPAIVVLDLDLRGASTARLVEVMRKYRNVVLALFGNLEGSTELPSADYMRYAQSFGYDELPRESNGVVCRLPPIPETNTGSVDVEGQEGSAFVPSLTQAVLDLHSKVKGLALGYIVSKEPEFISYRPIKYFQEPLQDLNLAHDSKSFKDRIVLVSTKFTQKHLNRVDPNRHRTPLENSVYDVNIHAAALQTMLDNQAIKSWPRDIAHHLLLLLGAGLGAVASILPMNRRVTVFLCTGMVLFVVSQIAFQLFQVNIPVASPIAVLFLSACLGTFIYLDTDLRLRNKELAEARESMQVRAEEERQRIAEDLHDETLPALSSVARMADRLAEELTDNQVPVQMREKLDFAVVEMRRVINDLHPSVLETMGFKPALENLAVMLSRETGIESNFNDGDGHDDYDFSNFTKLQLYRIVQEALNNVQKHSAAKLVELSIGEKNGSLIISVADNGKGIDRKLIRKDSHGLLNIRQRAQLINAQVEWRKPEKFNTGTELRLKIAIETEHTGEGHEHTDS
jgi:signal transduction histidine kinase